jgi:hypothetical protein
VPEADIATLPQNSNWERKDCRPEIDFNQGIAWATGAEMVLE